MAVDPAVEEYIDSLPGDRRGAVRAMHERVHLCRRLGRLPRRADAERLGKVSVGKSCVRFSRLENLDLYVTSEHCRRAVRLVGEGRFGL